MMSAASVVLLHHDGPPAMGATARVELGYLSALGVPTVVHVDLGTAGRPYMEALVAAHPAMRWCETLTESVEVAAALARANRDGA